mgnify:CR=1 FL=1
MMRALLILAALSLTACQSVPTKPEPIKVPVILTRYVERYVPIDPLLTWPAIIPEIKTPSDVAEVAAERKRALLDCNRRLSEIANIQGAVKDVR